MLESSKKELDDLLEIFHTEKEETLGHVPDEIKTFDRGYALGITCASAGILRHIVDSLIQERDSNWALVDGIKIAKAIHEVGHIMDGDLRECEDLQDIMKKFEAYVESAKHKGE